MAEQPSGLLVLPLVPPALVLPVQMAQSGERLKQKVACVYNHVYPSAIQRFIRLSAGTERGERKRGRERETETETET